MDIWIASDPDNLRPVLNAIRDFAFPAAPDDLLNEADAMVRMGVPPLRRRLEYPAISLEDLKRNKLAAGSKKDLLDLDGLPWSRPAALATSTLLINVER